MTRHIHTRSRIHRLLAVTTLLFVGALIPVAGAVGTRMLVVDDAASFSAGEMNGTAVISSGAVVVGVGRRRIALDGVALAASMARADNGDVFIGTGNDGKILRLRGDVVTHFAQTEQLLVSALAMGSDGTLYAGTLPSGKVFAIDGQGRTREFAQLVGAKHVWSLRFDAARKTLFAATGPEGKVFSIDTQGRAEVFYDTDAGSHVLDIALDGQGGIYAAISDESLLLHVAAPGRAEVVYDFATTEITAIAVRGTEIAVAANTFPRASTTPPVTSSTTTSSTTTTTTTPATTTAPSTATVTTRGTGKGQLWRVTTTGRGRKLLDVNDAHITRVQWTDDGSIYAALGHDGRVLRVHADGTHAVWLDVDERQVLAIDLTGPTPLLLTGDTGAIYRVLTGPADERIWTSKVLDAQFRSRWGQLTWRGEGSVRMQSRSGNTDKPDATWSQWSAPLTAPGPLRSPPSRFLQLRATLGPNPDTIVHAVGAYYLPDNQPATVRDIQIKPTRSPTRKTTETTSTGTTSEHSSTQYKVTWDVDNPDDDTLRYRLSFRAESQAQWRPIERETEVITAKEWTWDTSSIPDGFYRVRVEASDEHANPEDLAERSSQVSEPFLIDNHAPQVLGLRVERGRLLGKATDRMGPITKLEYAVDGQPWKLFFPIDDLLDTAEESFALPLPALSTGAHIIAVRATDAAGNVGSAELTTR